MQTHTQNQIKSTLAQLANIQYVCELIKTGNFKSRTQLARAICHNLGFFDIRGKAQLGGCLKALRELEKNECYTLPPGCNKAHRPSPRRLNSPVKPACDVPDNVAQVKGLKLVLVETTHQIQTWNELMITEHDLGSNGFVGRQVRYLIESEHGILGGLGFAAPALHLADRDQWIGWTPEQRRDYLHYVVNLNRFLIRPGINCSNLGSKVLSMGIKAMIQDFTNQYNYTPMLVETFVDSSRAGTCFKAANWVHVGQTKGRGRQGKSYKGSLAIKDIYLYTIHDDFRFAMGLESKVVTPSPLELSEGLESDIWAYNEFGGAMVGDLRLSKRLVQVAGEMAESPGVAYSSVNNNWAAVKGYYRFIDKADDSALTMSSILQPHYERTMRRMQSEDTVLCIQDGTDLNYNNLDKCSGLGVISTNQTGAKSRGLKLHSTLTTTTNGLPLGLVNCTCSAPEPKAVEDTRSADSVPIEEKKNIVWLEHHRELVKLKPQLPETRIIHVCDREADFFELFSEQRKDGSVELLVRAKHNRKVHNAPDKLFVAASEAPILGRVKVHVPRQSARSKKSKQKAKPKRSEREAVLVLRSEKVEFRPGTASADTEPVVMWVVHALEEHPPANDEAVQWYLLNSMQIESFEDAEQCLRWYCLRWRIEDWHRVLKSGCKIEKLAHKSAERLRRAIAINMVIAWRIMLMTLLGREVPGLPAEIMFSDIELKVLRAYSAKKKLTQPDKLGDAVILVAKLGGYIGRKNDPPPGHQIIWNGYSKLQHMCEGFSLLDSG